MTLLLTAHFLEQQDPIVANEFVQLLAAIQTQLGNNPIGPIRGPAADYVSLALGLVNAEQLPPFVREEFEQLIAALQAAANPVGESLFLTQPVQSGVIAMPAGSQTRTQQIAVVDPNNTCVTFLEEDASVGADPDNTSIRLELTNGTTLTCFKGQLNNAGGNAGYMVREYQPGVLASSVQRGTITLTGVLSKAIQITPVTQANAIVTHLGVSSSSGGPVDFSVRVRLRLTDGVTLTALRGDATGSVTVGYEVYEYK